MEWNEEVVKVTIEKQTTVQKSQGNFVTRFIEFLLTTWPGRGLLVLGLAGAGFGLWLAWFLISPLFLTGEQVNEELINAPTMEMPAPGGTGGAGETSMPAEGVVPPMSGDDPVLVLTGEFNQIDRFHYGHGLANIYRLPDGSHVLQLEDAPGDVRAFRSAHGEMGEEVDGWEISPGPQLAVYLSANTDFSSTSSRLGESVSVRSLGGVTSGELSITLPDDLDIDDYRSVVIWCVPFGVNFTGATLSAP